MKTVEVRTLGIPRQMAPPHDYRAALQGALSWLGKRYLLAEPLNRRPDDRGFRTNEPQRT